jgi:hypothetical protein
VIFDVFRTKAHVEGDPPVTLPDFDLSKLLSALKAGEMTDTSLTSLEWKSSAPTACRDARRSECLDSVDRR